MYSITEVTINNITYTALTDGIEYLVNLCPHSITMVVGEEPINIPPSGQLARRSQKTVRSGRMFCGFPVSHNEYGEVTGLPEATTNVGFFVSGLVKGDPSCRDRADVFAPSETVRDTSGQVAGATSLGE